MVQSAAIERTSEIRTAVLPHFFSASTMMSLEMMSSFFWSSPWTLAVPAAPMLARQHVKREPTHRLSKVARRTLNAIWPVEL